MNIKERVRKIKLENPSITAAQIKQYIFKEDNISFIGMKMTVGIKIDDAILDIENEMRAIDDTEISNGESVEIDTSDKDTKAQLTEIIQDVLHESGLDTSDPETVEGTVRFLLSEIEDPDFDGDETNIIQFPNDDTGLHDRVRELEHEKTALHNLYKNIKQTTREELTAEYEGTHCYNTDYDIIQGTLRPDFSLSSIVVFADSAELLYATDSMGIPTRIPRLATTDTITRDLMLTLNPSKGEGVYIIKSINPVQDDIHSPEYIATNAAGDLKSPTTIRVGSKMDTGKAVNVVKNHRKELVDIKLGHIALKQALKNSHSDLYKAIEESNLVGEGKIKTSMFDTMKIPHVDNVIHIGTFIPMSVIKEELSVMIKHLGMMISVQPVTSYPEPITYEATSSLGFVYHTTTGVNKLLYTKMGNSIIPIPSKQSDREYVELSYIDSAGTTCVDEIPPELFEKNRLYRNRAEAELDLAGNGYNLAELKSELELSKIEVEKIRQENAALISNNSVIRSGNEVAMSEDKKEISKDNVVASKEKTKQAIAATKISTVKETSAQIDTAARATETVGSAVAALQSAMKATKAKKRMVI